MIGSRENEGFRLSYAGVTFFLALYFALVMNIHLYKDLIGILGALEDFSIGFVLTIPIFMISALTLIFNIFNWPYVGRPFFILLLILSSMVSYAGFNYGILFDDNMITNIFHTDTGEAFSYLSLKSVLWVLLMGGVPALILARIQYSKDISFPMMLLRKVGAMAVSVAVIGVIALFYYQDYASITRNNNYLKKTLVPTYYVQSTYKYVKKEYFTPPIPYQQIGLDAKQTEAALAVAREKPTLMILVLGETARSQNFELNGYDRPTNAYTREHGVVSFKDVQSCGTATAISVPCMFSNMNRKGYKADIARNRDNLLDVMQRAGISILWKENDGGDKGVVRNIPKIIVDRKRDDDMCRDRSCYDMALLEGFDDNIKSLTGNRMIALHLMGSHGPTYYQRYPVEMRKFEPDCPRSDIENCTVEEIVNTYDNTILYSDYVMAEVIKKLKSYEDQYNTALVYVSDHGESLGENGLFLHGLPYSIAPDYQTRVPMLLWMSEGFQQVKGINFECVRHIARKTGTYSHDNLFHTMLGIMDVETQDYHAKQDMLRECRSLNS